MQRSARSKQDAKREVAKAALEMILDTDPGAVIPDVPQVMSWQLAVCKCQCVGISAAPHYAFFTYIGGGGGGGGGSLVPRPTLAVADGLHHRYARNGSGKQPNKSRSGLFRANSDVIGVGVAATLTDGVIGQLVYSNKMNRCKFVRRSSFRMQE